MHEKLESRGLSAAKVEPPDASRQSDLRAFVVRVVVVAGFVALLFLAWQARHALLLIFAAMVVAVIFDAASRPFSRWARFSRRWALAAAALTIATALGLVGWLIGAPLAEQFGQLVTALQEAEPMIRGWLGFGGSNGGEDGSSSAASKIFDLDWVMSATSWGFGAVGAVGSLVLVIVAGYFLATEPSLYQRATFRRRRNRIN